MLTQELLKEFLDYREDGHLYWIKVHPKTRTTRVGNRYGSLSVHGYIEGQLLKSRYQEHRLVWLYHYGNFPIKIDHINRDKCDNRIENLRECTAQTNSFNRESVKNSSSKYKGVSWCKQTKKWRAATRISGKVKHIGRFKTEIEAAKAYDSFVEDVHKEFFNSNIKEK